MNATISLDQPGNVAYTNLDMISGRVVVRTAKAADISKIEVKLEGESRTRLLSPQGPNGERPKPMVEYHKILYRIQTVFPPTDIMESRVQASAKAAYTLPPGQHEYPFNFKVSPVFALCPDELLKWAQELHAHCHTSMILRVG